MSTFTDLEKDAASVDGFVNENGLIPTRRNGPKPSYQYLVDGWNAEIAATILELNKSRGFRVVGKFADGFTYELFNDVGIDADGNSWIYVGAGAPNKVVAAGTVPSVGAGYEQVTFNALQNLVGLDQPSGLDRIYNRRFDSVAPMINGSYEIGDKVETSSYHAGWAVELRAPRGGGKYNIVSKAHHDSVRGTSIVDELCDHTVSGGLVALLVGCDINIEQAGAKPDGTDCSPSIQSAVRLFKNIEVTEGVFEIASTIKYPPQKKIWGSGENCVIKLVDGVNTNMFYPDVEYGTKADPNSASVDGVTFKNFHLNHNITIASDFVESVMTIVALSARMLRINGMTFSNPSGDCIYINKTYGGSGSTVLPRNISIKGCAFNGENINRNAISVVSGRKIRIKGNSFYKITSDSMPSPIDLEPNNVTDIISDVVISGNNFDQCKGGVSTYLTGAEYGEWDTISNVTVTGNTFSRARPTAGYSSNNQAYIYISNCKGATVTGNTLTEPASAGIVLRRSKDAKATGNSITSSAETGVLIEDCKKPTVDSNTISVLSDKFRGQTAYGIRVTTSALVSASNHAMVGGSISNNVIYADFENPSASAGIGLEGGVKDVAISGSSSGFKIGLYVGSRANKYPSGLKVNLTLKNNVEDIKSLDTGYTPDNEEWNCGKGVSFGRSQFDGATTKTITGLHVFPTSVLEVNRVGASAGNNLSIDCPTKGQIVIYSEAAESGGFVWRIISP